ncbi:MAG: S49 family peptidase [Desulfohalobiaceae bacterium]|nr:S49 family peptidase [Desulfohalobiaceae bacterium]
MHQAILADPGFRPRDTELTSVRDGVAVIEVIGPIFHYRNILTEIFGLPSSEAVLQELQAALGNPNVQTIVLQIDSPGGQVGGVSELSGFIRGQSTKPIYAFVSDTATSAAFWIASATDRVITAPTAELGSIGVVFSMRRRSNNVLEIVSSTSPKKRPDPETDEGRKQILQRADAIAEVFIQAVMTNRGISRDQILSLAGDVTIASQAINLGLADGIGTLEGFTADLAKGKLPKEGTMLARKGTKLSELKGTASSNSTLPAGGNGQSQTLDLTPEQEQLMRQVFGSRAGHNQSGQAGSGKDFAVLVDEHQQKHGCKRSKAMAVISGKYPELHQAWLSAHQPQPSNSEPRQPKAKHQFMIDAELISVEQNIPLSQAIAILAKEKPDLHLRYLEEVNAG